MRRTSIAIVLACLLLATLAYGQWLPDQRLTADLKISQTSYNNAWCVAAAGDTAHVVWQENRDGNYEIYYKRSTDNGANWGDDIRLTNDVATSGMPSVAVAGDAVHVVWHDTRDGTNPEIYYKRSTNGGANWGSDIRLTKDAKSSYNSSVAVAGDAVHVVWFDNRDLYDEIYYKRSTDNGATWPATDTRLTNVAAASVSPSVAVAGDAVHVVWEDARDGNREIYYKRSTDNGATWPATDTRLTNDVAGSYYPSVAVAGAGVHVVWHDTRISGTNYEIYYKRSTDNGANWGSDIRLTNDGAPSKWPSVAVAGDAVHVVWEDTRAGNDEIYYKRSTDNGATWPASPGGDTRLTEDAATSNRSSVAVAGAGVHVVWYDKRDGNFEIYYKRNPTGLLPPNPFALLTPAKGATNVAVAGNLTWQASGLATTYDVLYDVFTPPTTVRGNVSGTTLPYSGLANSTKYYWAVVAKNADGFTRCKADFDFTTIVAAPAAPTLVSPDDGVVNQPIAGILTWNEAARATGYDVYLDVVNPPAIKVSSNQPGLTYNYSGLEYFQTYYWRTAARNVGGTADSDVWNFRTIVAAPTVAVTSPNGGEVWPVGSTQSITCTHGGGLTVSDSVLLTTDGGLTWLFQFKAEAAGSHPWTVPNNPATAAKVKVVTINVGGMGEDISDAGFVVAFPDAGALAVIAPRGSYPRGTSVEPVAMWRNYGNVPVSFEAWMILAGPSGATVYSEKVDVLNLPPATNATVTTFPPCPLPTAGTWSVRCSTYLAGDLLPDNDVIDAGFFVANRDVGVISIEVPQGRYPRDTTITPQATWRNCGNVAANFEAWMILAGPSGVREYGQKVDVSGLAVGRDTTISAFLPHTLAALGSWSVRCSTYYTGDEYPGNDVIDDGFLVETGWPEDWTKVAPMPNIPTAKPVKDGGWLTVGPGDALFVAKGNKTGDFYSYDVVLDTWQARESIPAGEAGKNKPPSKGCVGVSDGGNYVYMTKGNNTLGFWRYNIEGDSWELLPGVPEGLNRKRVKGGTDMVYAVYKDTGCVFLLKGYKTEFYRYNTEAERWDTLPNAPSGGGKAKYDKGSFLAYDPAGYVYAHQAKYNDGTNHYMFRFDVLTGLWTDTLKGMPVFGLEGGREKKKKSKDGAAGAWYNGCIYALKGGNTEQYWKHTPDAETAWTQLAPMPLFGDTAEKKKRVKAGADLVSYGYGAFFALKGNKTLDLWRFVEPADGLQLTAGRYGVMAGELIVHRSSFIVSPNPIAAGFATVRFGLPTAGPVAVTVFDVAGRSVLATRSPGHLVTGSLLLDLRKQSNGVYLVRLDAEQFTATQKLVVQR